jgi:acyl-CoA reductase-like NAD-dependent aldehyde dehydrogenase
MFVVPQESIDGGRQRNHYVFTSLSGLRTVAFVDRTTQVEHAAEDLALARFLFRGQSPYAPDLVLVNEFCVQPFLKALMKHAAQGLGLGQYSDAPPVHRRSKKASQLDRLSTEKGTQVVASGSEWVIAWIYYR